MEDASIGAISKKELCSILKLTLSNDSVGWQEYNSNNRDNAIAGQLQQINNDLGNNVNPSLSTEQRVNSLLTQTDDTQVGFLLNALNQNLILQPMPTE